MWMGKSNRIKIHSDDRQNMSLWPEKCELCAHLRSARIMAINFFYCRKRDVLKVSLGHRYCATTRSWCFFLCVSGLKSSSFRLNSLSQVSFFFNSTSTWLMAHWCFNSRNRMVASFVLNMLCTSTFPQSNFTILSFVLNAEQQPA